jgi:hypothetical protein
MTRHILASLVTLPLFAVSLRAEAPKKPTSPVGTIRQADFEKKVIVIRFYPRTSPWLGGAKDSSRRPDSFDQAVRLSPTVRLLDEKGKKVEPTAKEPKGFTTDRRVAVWVSREDGKLVVNLKLQPQR